MRAIKKALWITAAYVTVGVFAASAQQAPPPPPQPPQAKEDAKGKLFISVETPPSFPDGIAAFGQYMASTIKYPAVDRQNKVQGKVFVQFVVEPDGSLSDVSAIRGPSETLKAEAARVVQASPKWKPGIQNGKPVRVQYTVPVNFTLDKPAKQ